jgi:Pyridoxamine 5'-phosphate oxidase
VDTTGERLVVEELRNSGVQAYVKAYRTAEHSALRWLTPFLADDVRVEAEGRETRGRVAVVERLAGVRPMLTALTSIGFAAASREDGGRIRVVGDVPPLGAAPDKVVLEFSFNERDEISLVTERLERRAEDGGSATVLPPFVRGCFDGALGNGTPVTFAYVDLDGCPRVSLRGSTHVYGDMQLAIWLRPTDRSAGALEKHPAVALIYRDTKTRTTLTVKGTARVEHSAEIRNRVFNLIPEIEQTHDPERRGQALVIDVEEVDGTSPLGRVRVRRA